MLMLACLAVAEPQSGDSQQEKSNDPATARLEAALQTAELSLARLEVLPTEAAGPVFVSQFCDEEGNIYFRRYSAQNPVQGAIQKVNKHRESVAMFRPTSGGDSELAGGRYVLAADGEILQLGWYPGKNGTFLLRYGKDGALKSKAKLSIAILPDAVIGVFGSGEVLLSGFERAKDESLHPWTGIFKSDGSFVTRLHPPKDQAIWRPDGESADRPPQTEAFHQSRLVRGADGNLYLLRRTHPATVYVINPKGETLRTLRIASDTHYPPSMILEHEGKLLILFKDYGPGDGELVFADAHSGEVERSYKVPNEFGSSLTCYSPPQIVFMTTQRGRLALAYLEPR